MPRTGADDLAATRGGYLERLFHDHVLAGCRSRQREVAMQSVGRHDDDRIDVGIRQQRGAIRIGLLGAVLRSKLFRLDRVARIDRLQHGALDLGQLPGMGLGTHSGADQCITDHVPHTS
jgi:hypothetical protein